METNHGFSDSDDNTQCAAIVTATGGQVLCCECREDRLLTRRVFESQVVPYIDKYPDGNRLESVSAVDLDAHKPTQLALDGHCQNVDHPTSSETDDDFLLDENERWFSALMD